jgi:hypothetical protein
MEQILYKYDPKVNDPEPNDMEGPEQWGPAHEAPPSLSAQDEYTTEFHGELCEYNALPKTAKTEPKIAGPFLNHQDRYYELYRDLVDFRHQYPDRTQTCCWHCVHPFDSRPLGLPVRRDDASGSYMGFGCFCSPACALTYAEARKMDTNLLRQMYAEMETITPLRSAPPQSMLNLFGGPWDIDRFRENASRSYKWRTYKWPLMPYIVLREEIIQDTRLLPIRKIQPRSANPPRNTKLRSLFSRAAKS